MQSQCSPAAQTGFASTHQTPCDLTGQVAQVFVGESRERMCDQEREEAIRRAGKAIESHMARYAKTSDLMDRGDADRARLLMQRLIAGRSAEQVAKLELERGLR